MNALYQPLLFIHITAGFIALALFWVPIFTRKGGTSHRKVGLWYVRFMWIAVVSAALLAVRQWLEGSHSSAVFFAFLSLLTARPLWLGMLALAQKHQLTKGYQMVYPASSALLVIAGASLIIYALQSDGSGQVVLLYIFGGIGMTALFDLIGFVRKSASQRQADWMKEHITNMCTSGIAAHTAFFAFGGHRILPAEFMAELGFIPWVLPSIIGVAGIAIATRKRRPNRTRASQSRLGNSNKLAAH
jgi:hypothetical protein